MSEAVEFLAEAIKTHNDWGNTPFMRKVVRRAMQDALEEVPGLVSLPDGNSILIELLTNAPLLAAEWFELRGPEAWLATDRTPYPLPSAIPLLLKRHRHLDHDCAFEKMVNPGKLAASFQDMWYAGLDVAIPLTKSEAALRALDPVLNADLFMAQASLVEGMVKLNISENLLVSSTRKTSPLVWKSWKKFNAKGAALVFINNFYGDDVDLSGRMWQPSSPAFRLQDENKLASGSWSSLWSSECHDSWELSRLMDWNKKGGVDITELNKRYLSLSVDDYAEDRNKRTLAQRWSSVHEFLSEQEAWYEENGEGLLLWQSVLGDHPKLISEALRLPPPAGLGQKSVSGLTLWDALLDVPAIDIPKSAVPRLLRACPLEAKSPLLHNCRDRWSPAGLLIADTTLAENPALWVGSPGAPQSRWAKCVLLDTLADGPIANKDNCRAIMSLLSCSSEAQGCLGPVAQGALWVYQSLVASKDIFEIPITSMVDPPKGKCWSRDLYRLLKNKNNVGEIATKLLATARNLITRNHLQAVASPGVHPARPAM